MRVGRPPALSPAQIKHARKLIGSGERPKTVAKTFGVSRSTLYRYLKTN
ncbi:MAG: helix-turn-helix domain-containing protein [Nitratireductor sp.]